MLNTIFAAAMRQVTSQGPPPQSPELRQGQLSTSATVVPDSEESADELQIVERVDSSKLPQSKRGHKGEPRDQYSSSERLEKEGNSKDPQRKEYKQYTRNGFSYISEQYGEEEGCSTSEPSVPGSFQPSPTDMETKENDPDVRYGPPRQTRKLPATRVRVDTVKYEDAPKSFSDTPPLNMEEHKTAIRTLKAENETLKKEVEHVLRAYKHKEAEFKERMEEAEHHYRKKKKELAQCETYCQELEQRNRQLEAGKSEQIRASEHRDALLDVRTKELSVAQAFLTMTDTCSGSDVINMVQRLNAEINQASAYMADLVEDLPEEQTQHLSWETCIPEENARGFAQFAIGSDLLSFLKQKGPTIRRNTFPFQTAIQALLTSYVVYNVNRFCGAGANDMIHSLYADIRESETQAVSGKWRAITSQKLQTLFNKLLGGHLRSILKGLLAMAGWHVDLRDKEAANCIDDFLTTIHKLSMEIKVTTKQGIISCDLDLLVIQKSVSFDPTMMTDSANNGGRSTKSNSKRSQDKVLCTVALGLVKSKTEPVEGGKYEVTQQILLKPEVILLSSLHASDSPEDDDTKMVE